MADIQVIQKDLACAVESQGDKLMVVDSYMQVDQASFEEKTSFT